MTSHVSGRTPPDRNAGAVQSRDRRWRFPVIRRAGTVRVLCHLAVWAAILIPLILELAGGWRPLNDDATISLRSYQVLSLHPPLLGQFSTISYGSGHLLFDPGPLQYWMLTVPVHLDPAQGGLWGAALCCGLVLSVTVEAMWRTGHRVGGVVVATAVVVLAWLLPEVFAHPVWNPYFGLLFLSATVAVSWVVATGSLGWWPVLVVTASVAAQSELIYSLLAISLTLVSPVVGIVVRGRPERMRWLGMGIGVGALCWVAPLIQEATSSSGNLTLLLDARGAERASGIGFGLRSLAIAGSPNPIWLTHGAGWSNNKLFTAHSATTGVAVLGVVVVIAVAAWWTGRRDLAALATIGTVCSVVAVWTFGTIPEVHQLNLIFLIYYLWVIGILVWVILGWAVFEAVRTVTRAVASDAVAERLRRRRPLLATLGGLAALGVVLGVGALAVGGLRTQATVQVASPQVAQVARIVSSIEAKVPAGPVAIELKPDLGRLVAFSSQFSYGTAVGWQLTADGWQPALPAVFTAATGVTYPAHVAWPTVVVTIEGYRVVSVDRIR